jgi:hypothetical protein
MNIHQVDNKETMLNENDIVIVAAYMSEITPDIEEAAHKHGVSPERLLYTAYVQEMQNPALIRIRDGNTLFTIAALPERYGYVSMYNGDTEDNVATNFNQFLQSAYKIGFNILAVSCKDESLNNASDEIESLARDEEFSYDEKDRLLYVKFSQPHGD